MSSRIKKYVDCINNINGNVLLGYDGLVDKAVAIVEAP